MDVGEISWLTLANFSGDWWNGKSPLVSDEFWQISSDFKYTKKIRQETLSAMAVGGVEALKGNWTFYPDTLPLTLYTPFCHCEFN